MKQINLMNTKSYVIVVSIAKFVGVEVILSSVGSIDDGIFSRYELTVINHLVPSHTKLV